MTWSYDNLESRTCGSLNCYVYLCVWLNLCIKRLPSASLIWILVVGIESSITTGPSRKDFSSSSGEEGVLTISGVRLKQRKNLTEIGGYLKVQSKDIKLYLFLYTELKHFFQWTIIFNKNSPKSAPNILGIMSKLHTDKCHRHTNRYKWPCITTSFAKQCHNNLPQKGTHIISNIIT